MRIGIDARFLGPSGKGLGRYVQQLILNLEAVDKTNQYVIFLTRQNWNFYQPAGANFIKVLADFRWYGFKEQIVFPWLILKHRLDLMHFPHFNVPIFCPSKFLMTIHDLILHRFPTRRATTLGPLRWHFKNFGYGLVFFIARRRAKKIISVSQFTKQDIKKEFNLPPQKIVVILEGASFAVPNAKPRQKSLFNSDNRYFLYVGNAYPHKNLKTLIEAFADFQKLQPYGQLVLVGREDYFYRQIKDFVRRAGVQKVIFTGQVGDEELAGYYGQALALVLPSFYEGFGLTGLEAMSFGVPIISSRAAALLEIFGPAALYFDPKNKKELQESMVKLWQDPVLGQALIQRGYQQIKKYSWQKMARQTLKIYQEII